MKSRPVLATMNSAFPCIQLDYTSQEPPKSSWHPLTAPVSGHHHLAPRSFLGFTLIPLYYELKRFRVMIQIIQPRLNPGNNWDSWTFSYPFLQVHCYFSAPWGRNFMNAGPCYTINWWMKPRHQQLWNSSQRIWGVLLVTRTEELH